MSSLSVSWDTWIWVVLTVVALIVLHADIYVKLNANKAVGAVYRAAIKAAVDIKEEGLEWLRSPAGIAYRRQLIDDAYEALPGGLFKTVVSIDKWREEVEVAFQAMVRFATALEPVKRIELED